MSLSFFFFSFFYYILFLYSYIRPETFRYHAVNMLNMKIFNEIFIPLSKNRKSSTSLSFYFSYCRSSFERKVIRIGREWENFHSVLHVFFFFFKHFRSAVGFVEMKNNFFYLLVYFLFLFIYWCLLCVNTRQMNSVFIHIYKYLSVNLKYVLLELMWNSFNDLFLFRFYLTHNIQNLTDVLKMLMVRMCI